MARNSAAERRKRLRKLLTAARKDAGLSQADVAKRFGKPQAFVSRYETGERQLDVAELLDLAEILKLDPHSIIDELA
jgi:transcriptional regulator with XRE-family HTH domain